MGSTQGAPKGPGSGATKEVGGAAAGTVVAGPGSPVPGRVVVGAVVVVVEGATPDPGRVTEAVAEAPTPWWETVMASSTGPPEAEV